jgi:hypothetical protein
LIISLAEQKVFIDAAEVLVQQMVEAIYQLPIDHLTVKRVFDEEWLFPLIWGVMSSISDQGDGFYPLIYHVFSVF